MSTLIYKNGIWYSDKSVHISYPAKGNETCYQIEDDSYWFSSRNKTISEVLLRSITEPPNTISFLDLGGGNGFVSKHLQNFNFDISLLEPGIGAYNAHKRGVKKVYKCTIDELPEGYAFDYIGMFDVLEHIEHPELFLKKVNRFLKPNGKIILTVPSYSFLWSKEDEDAGHIRRYTLSSLKRELHLAGFSLQYSTYFFSALVVPIFLFRTIPTLLRIKRSQKSLQHHRPSRLLSKTFTLIFQAERWFIRKNLKPLFGSSLLAIAESSKIQTKTNFNR